MESTLRILNFGVLKYYMLEKYLQQSCAFLVHPNNARNAMLDSQLLCCLDKWHTLANFKYKKPNEKVGFLVVENDIKWTILSQAFFLLVA